MPASGYYGWRTTPEGKQPYYFTRRDGQAMTIAGLWSDWTDRATGEALKSCTMLITASDDDPRCRPGGGADLPRHRRCARFQTIHRCSVDVARGLVLLFGIGTKALPSWDSRTRRKAG
jgi:hypothetical protein